MEKSDNLCISVKWQSWFFCFPVKSIVKRNFFLIYWSESKSFSELKKSSISWIDKKKSLIIWSIMKLCVSWSSIDRHSFKLRPIYFVIFFLLYHFWLIVFFSILIRYLVNKMNFLSWKLALMTQSHWLSGNIYNFFILLLVFFPIVSKVLNVSTKKNWIKLTSKIELYTKRIIIWIIIMN